MRWGLLLGCAAAVGGVAWVMLANPGPGNAAAVGPVKNPPAGGNWVPLEGEAIELRPGVRYRACVRVGFLNPLRLALTVDRIQEGLLAEGFKDVRVASGDTPLNWDETSADCFRYVDATWGRAPKLMDRPGLVDRAWRWVEA